MELAMDNARNPVFDSSVCVDWEACPLVETCSGTRERSPTLKELPHTGNCIVSNFDARGSPEEIADMFRVSNDSVRGTQSLSSRLRGSPDPYAVSGAAVLFRMRYWEVTPLPSIREINRFTPAALKTSPCPSGQRTSMRSIWVADWIPKCNRRSLLDR
jgi:hypothetical protein